MPAPTPLLAAPGQLPPPGVIAKLQVSLLVCLGKKAKLRLKAHAGKI